jgi:ABC-2 type transport system permease protein
MASENPSENARVGSLNQIAIVTKYAFLNYFRARRFYVMLGIVLLISGFLTFAAAYYQPVFFGFGLPAAQNPALRFYASFWGLFVTLVLLLSAVFFGGDAISGEFQNKTGYFLVPNPLRRSVVFVGKWIAAFGAASIMFGVFAVVTLANGVYFFGAIPYQFGESFLFAWFHLVAILALTFMFSSLFKNSSISILVTVILLIFAFNVIDTIASAVAGIEPWFSLTYAGGIISSILRIPYPTNGSVGIGRFAESSFYATVPEGLAINLVYIVVTSIIGLWLFERKEFNS